MPTKRKPRRKKAVRKRAPPTRITIRTGKSPKPPKDWGGFREW